MDPVYECITFYLFQHIIDKSKRDYFYFVEHKKHYQLYLRLRSVCKLWNERMLMKLPKRKHLRITPHNDVEFEQKIPLLASNNDTSLYFKSHLTLFCANKCTARKLLLVSDLYSHNITKLFVEEFPNPDVNVPIILSKLTNLQQIHISRAHWSSRFTFASPSLQSITLQNCLGMRTMKFACPLLRLFVFDRGILEIPFLEDIGERKLRFIIQSLYHVDVIVKGLSLNNLKLYCSPATKSIALSVVKCLGLYFKLASRANVEVSLRNCFYSKVLIEGERMPSLDVRDMKLKMLRLRCAKLQKFVISNSVIKSPDYCSKSLQALKSTQQQSKKTCTYV